MCSQEVPDTLVEEETDAPAVAFSMVAGRLCLDFVNTVSGDRRYTVRERLNHYADLVAWSQQAGILADREAQRLREEADRRPDEAHDVLDRAVRLRETIYRIFWLVSEGNPPSPADLDALNRSLADALVHRKVVWTTDGFAWRWQGPDRALDRMLWPIAHSAAELLTSGDLGRVRECAGDTCGWLFVDTSKNRSRRWCDMKDCGNRAKARRHYHRTRASRRAGR
jgi:predicted RNA-binding Zn ribbon-like protein